MKKKFFKPNWKAIIAALDLPNGSEERKDFFNQWNGIKDKMKNEIQASITRKFEAERDAKIKALKGLPLGSIVFYDGMDKRILGKPGKKIRDKYKYMIVEMEGKTWQIPYINLQLNEPSKEHLETKKAFINIFE